MAAGNDDSGSESNQVSESRQRLRPWIIYQLDNNTIPGLQWIDKQAMKFKIPWKHGGKQDWVPEQGQIFMQWARHTGKYTEGVDTPQYAKWKTNLRCALNKAPDIREIKEMACKDDSDPYKVYQFLPKQKKQIRTVNIPAHTSQVSPVNQSAYEVPTFVADYSSSGSFQASGPSSSGNLTVKYEGLSIKDEERLPSDLNSIKSLDLMHMSAGGGSRQPSLTGAVQSQEGMEFEESTENDDSSATNGQPRIDVYDRTFETVITTSSSSCHQTYTDLSNVSSYSAPTMTDMKTAQSSHEPTFARGPPLTLATPIFDCSYQIGEMNAEISSPANPDIHLTMPGQEHHCVPAHRGEMNLEILYRGQWMDSHHITSPKGCRITDHILPHEEEIPSVLNDVLYGVDSKERTVILLPQWPLHLGEQVLASVNDLLKHMQRGLLLDCKNGDINAIRLCKTSIYFCSMFSKTQKLVRHDSSIEVTKIFDIENDFKPALDNYKDTKMNRPSPDVHLFIGQKGTSDALTKLLLVLKITSCEALSLLRMVENDDHLPSIHISETNEMDTVSEAVRNHIQDEHNASGFNFIATGGSEDMQQ